MKNSSDKELETRLARCGGLGLKDLDLPAELLNEKLFEDVKAQFNKVNLYRTPRDKLVCIVNGAKLIGGRPCSVGMIWEYCSKRQDAPSGADEFLPTLIYCLFHAKVDAPFANLCFIK